MMDRDTKQIAILRRQYHVIYSGIYGIYFLPFSRQYNVVLPSQNRNLFLVYFSALLCDA